MRQSVSSAPVADRAAAASYGQILRSTALMGGTSLLNLAVAVVRSKAIAVMLGPAGMGLNGMYGSITNLAETIAGMGLNSSGVRQMAAAAGSGDRGQVARTAAVLRWTSLALGLAGAGAVAGFSAQISEVTFGNTGQTAAVCILALAVLCKSLSAGQGALLQGLRRVSDMARAGVLSTLAGTVLTIPLVYFLRERGVAVSLAASAAAAMGISWWYSRRLAGDPPPLTAREVKGEAQQLLHLGAALMVSSLVTVACAFVIRAAVFRQLGADATGLYQAAWTLGGLYVGLILQAMGSDFYPRLTAVVGDCSACNRLVNEQARVSLLLAGAGAIGTLTFASLVIDLFYSSRFQGAVPLLRWICLGGALQIVSWPIGTILVAKGEKQKLVWCELAWAAVHIGLALLGLNRYGLPGAGIAFFLSYVFHFAVVYALANRMTGFCLSPEVRRATVIYLLVIGMVFGGMQIFPPLWAMAVGGVAMVLYGVYSVRTLAGLVPMDRMPASLQRILGCARVTLPMT